MTQETGQKSNTGLLQDNKLYVRRARRALPILVRQAKALKPIIYSDLAEELGMPNPRNLNYVLGAIGNALEQLSQSWSIKIPPINCLVLNKNEGLPGEGVGWFLSEEDRRLYATSSKEVKNEIVGRMLADVFAFNRWDSVLKDLGLEPIETQISRSQVMSQGGKYGLGGESESHKKFKEYIYNNPSIIGLDRVSRVDMEYRLPSTDEIDVAFESSSHFIGVEVKSIISSEEDILRGLFQCVKYEALIRADQVVFSQRPKSSYVMLVLEGEFPENLRRIRNELGIVVVDNIKMT